MAYLFDTDAVSELFKPRPAVPYVRWLRTVPLADQFTSAVVVGELFKGAFASSNRARHLERIEKHVLPVLRILAYGLDAARLFGRIQAGVEAEGQPLADLDVQIAATAIHHDLELVTGNLRHFRRIPDLKLCPVLADARR